MRIAYILNTLQTGGAERLVLSLAERMRERGHQVLVLALREPGPGDLPTTVDVIHLRMRPNPARAAVGLLRAWKAIHDFQPQVMHCNQFHGNMLGRALHLAMPRVRVLSTVHNVFEGGRARMLCYRLTRGLAARTVAVCQAAADSFSATGACSSNVRVILNGIDAEMFSPDATRRRTVRARLHAGDAFVWLAASRIVPAKNLPDLLRAFATVHAHHPAAKLWIAGEGQPGYRAQLEEMSRNLGLDGAVEWLGLRGDMPELLDAADGFVLSSAWEGLPLVLGEAMAMEKPFVATDIGGVREMAGACGVLVHAGHPTLLAEGMLSVMKAKDIEREALGRLGRERIVEHFNLDAKATEWEMLYHELTG